MLDAVLSTMSSFTDKLTSMESRLTGLASRLEEPSAQKATGRKSRAREHSKKREPPDEDDTPLFSSPSGAIVKSDTGDAYLKTFPDTAVLLKTAATPARPKKQRPDFDLGVAPLPQESSKATPVSSLPVVRQAVATFARPDDLVAPPNWEGTQTIVGQTEGETLSEKQMVRDFNHNVYRHVDQFGNPVQVRAVAEPLPVVTHQDIPAVEKSADPPASTPITLDSLRMNPYIQQLVEERVAVLETRMKQELQQGGSHRKKSGRYNVSDTPLAPPHLRWPNETCLTGTARKKTPFDDLTFSQFVVGFVQNALDTPHPDTSRRMLVELVETAKLAENLSWPIARGAFAASMHQLEEQQITWQDSRTLADNRLTYSQAAVFSGSMTMSPKPSGNQPSSGTRKMVCRWYNEGSCPHSQDHTDTTGLTLFKHVCAYCFKFLKRSNGHVESECFNKKKAPE